MQKAESSRQQVQHIISGVFLLSAFCLLITPAIAFAAPQNFAQLVNLFLGLINPMVSILGSVAILIFLWGIIKYITSAGDEGHKQGRQLMAWGIVALFVMVSVWGLARLAVTVFLGSGA